ncbi:MAG TPA: serine hydrolase domain-containing protein [Candidatus Dormibacteraeota bacterium]|nr:serine hydrolase domain-containing protein [Candidatus Dormibacteraeota bacterium]
MSVAQIRSQLEKPAPAARSVGDLALEQRVDEILNRHPAIGLALGIIRNGRLEFFRGHGFADIESKTPITEHTVFRIGSITKTFTGVAVMQLWERGLLDLDAPANDYLRAFKLVPTKASFRPATVRHLLTHTAGIPEIAHRPSAGFWMLDDIVKAGRPVPSLAEYYRDGLRIDVEPGTRFVYTDHDFATLGQIVEDVSGVPFDSYLREHVFKPLGMDHTDVVRSERVRSHLASAYDVGSRAIRPIDDFDVLTAGGGAAYSTTKDMALYVAALLNGGSNEHGSVLKPATLATMFEPHHRTDPRLPGEGLVFSRAIVGGHLAVGHGGILPGFISQMWLAPADGLGVLAFTNGSRLAMLWLPGEGLGVLRQMLGAADEGVRHDVPQHPELWPDMCGWYKLRARLTDIRARAMVGGIGAEVFVRHGHLNVRLLTPIPALYRGFPLHPDDESDPYAFRIDISEFGMGTARVVFSQDGDGRTAWVHADFVPLCLEKQPSSKNPRYWVTGIVGALATAAAAAGARRLRNGS